MGPLSPISEVKRVNNITVGVLPRLRPVHAVATAERRRSPWLIFLVVASTPLIHLGVVNLPVFGFATVAAIIIAALLLAVANRSSAPGVAILLCCIIVVYPALLPRPEDARVPVTSGGDFDQRAGAQLAIVVAILFSSAILWLLTPGSAIAFRRAPLNLFALYGCLSLASLLYTADKQWTTFALFKLLEAVLLLAVMSAFVTTRDRLKTLVDSSLLAIAVVVLLYLLDILSLYLEIEVSDRITVSWLHANHASLLAALFTAVCAARFFTAEKRQQVFVAGGLTCFGSFTSIVAGGKTAVGAGLLALLFIAILSMRHRARSSSLTRTFVLIVGLALMSLYISAANLGVSANLSAYQANPYADLSTLTGRLPLWSTYLEIAMESPIFGHGYMSTYSMEVDNGFGWRPGSAHNVLIQTFVQLGVVGLVIVLVIYGAAWFSIVRQVLDCSSGQDRWKGSVELLGALAVLTVGSLTEDIFGGVFESRTLVFLLFVFAIHHNARLAESPHSAPLLAGGRGKGTGAELARAGAPSRSPWTTRRLK